MATHTKNDNHTTAHLNNFADRPSKENDAITSLHIEANFTEGNRFINKMKLTDSQTFISLTRCNKILRELTILEVAGGHTKSGVGWPLVFPRIIHTESGRSSRP